LALETPKPPEIVDTLEPDEEGMVKNSEHIDKFFEECTGGSLKRGRGASTA